MAEKDSFDVSPDRIEPKGKIRGVTRISRKAKTIAFIALGLVLLLVTIATYEGFQVNKPAAGENRAKEKEEGKPKKVTPTSFSEHMKGVSDGQSAMVSVEPAASGVSIAGGVEPLNPTGTMPGAGMPLPSGKSGIGGMGAAETRPTSGATAGKAGVDISGAGAKKDLFGDSASTEGGIRDPGRNAREMEDEKRRSAIESSMMVEFEVAGRNPSSGAGKASLGGLPDVGGLAGLANAAAGAGGGNRAMAANDDPNKQQRKEQFLKDAESQPDRSYLKETKRPAMSKFELAIGWKIPAALECGANSDLPGQLCAIVRENVCDSVTGKYLLIPQGTKVVGTYDSQVAIGQERILVVWNQLQFEDGSSLDLKGMPGSDQAGYAGFDADVDNHYMRAVGMTGMMSLFSAGLQLSQPQTSQTTGAPSAGQTIAGSVGQQVGQLGVQLTQRQMQIQPTLTRKPGYRFNIMVTRRVVFPGAHRTKWGGCS